MSRPDPRLREPARRLFFALWPDPDTREALVRATREGIRRSGGRPVPGENLHATLAFLGAVPEGRIEAVREAGRAAAAATPMPLELRVAAIDFWPRPQVLVALAETPAPAVALAERLWAGVEPLGIPRDPRPLRLHLTLARKLREPPAGLVLEPVNWTAGDLALVESATHPAGARYTPIARWPLGRPATGVTP